MITSPPGDAGGPWMQSHDARCRGARRRHGVALAGVFAMSLAAPLMAQPGTAWAVVPGANGELACEGGRGEPMNPEVYTVDPAGGGERVLTDEPVRDGDPSWSPDGTKIAFESFRDGGSEMYVMNWDGTGVTRLTFNGPGEDRGSSWSPDGTQITFHSVRGPASGPGHSALEIFTMNADGSGETRLTDNTFQDSLPSWSPDGSKIAFTSNRDGGDFEIYVMNADGSNPTRLTSSPGEDAHPAWSPDGSEITFHSRRTGNLDIFVMNADGSDVRQVTDTSTFEFFPVWSPDGTRIAFTGNTIDTSNFDVYDMNVDGSDITQLTFESGFDGRCDWGRLTPRSRDECKDGGWQQFNTSTFERFRNQGQCVSFVNESERNRL
jgi:Tol biopolymer transport system component